VHADGIAACATYLGYFFHLTTASGRGNDNADARRDEIRLQPLNDGATAAAAARLIIWLANTLPSISRTRRDMDVELAVRKESASAAAERGLTCLHEVGRASVMETVARLESI